MIGYLLGVLLALADAAGGRRPMVIARFRVGVLNAPERTDRSKRRLRQPIQRALGILRWRRAEGVALLFVLESGSVMRRALRRFGDLAASYGVPNTIIRGHQLGSGMILGRQLRIVRRADAKGRRRRVMGRIQVPVTERRRGARRGTRTRMLTMPIRLLEHQPSNVRFWAIAVHRPRAQARYAEARDAIDDALRAWCAEHPHELIVIGGDWNGDPPRIDGLRPIADHKVDTILASHAIVGAHEQAHRLPGFSDHHAVTVDLAINRHGGTA